jgi:hypothetical protein
MVLNHTLRLRRSTLIGWIFLPLLLCCVAYYFAFAANMNAYDGEIGLFQLALNSHDHKIYLLNIDLVRCSEDFFELANEKGTAWTYTPSPNRAIWYLFGVSFLQHGRFPFTAWCVAIRSETTRVTPTVCQF